jgi:hypothetical protein
MTQDDFIGLLKKQANISGEEAVRMQELLPRWAASSLVSHNPQYTWANVPDREIDCVILLAWIKVCRFRANKFAQDINEKSGSGYTQDSGTPYKKNMDLAKQLMEDYKQLVSDLKLIPVSEGVQQSDILTENDFNAVGPANALPTPDAPVLQQPQSGDITQTSVILRWSAAYFSNFHSFVILSDTSPNLYQDWNTDKIFGIEKLRTDVELIKEVYVFQDQAIKVTGLEPNTQYYFMIVTRARSGVAAYSNEIAVTTLA